MLIKNGIPVTQKEFRCTFEGLLGLFDRPSKRGDIMDQMFQESQMCMPNRKLEHFQHQEIKLRMGK
jgi:hypothetical protein